jgi:hypothetical protein
MEIKKFQPEITMNKDNFCVRSIDTAANIFELTGLKNFGDITAQKNSLLNGNPGMTAGTENLVINNQLPRDYGISQNYPNPFNPSTKIDYQLPFTSLVSITIYDITGKEIITLINETKNAGYYTAELNSNGIASGVYFYTITAKNGNISYKKTTKMVLVK